VIAHVKLLQDANLVEARFVGTPTSGSAMIVRMTNAGYDFLEASKQATLWEKAKEQLKAARMPLTIYTLKEGMELLIKAHFGK
jgi:hypothetical protein